MHTKAIRWFQRNVSVLKSQGEYGEHGERNHLLNNFQLEKREGPSVPLKPSIRLAGTRKMYSKNAMLQQNTITSNWGSVSNQRCPADAAVRTMRKS